MGRKRPCGRSVVEAIHESSVELRFEVGDESARIARDVAPFRNIFTDCLVRVLHGALLPAMVRMAEEDADAEKRAEPLMVPEQDIVIGRSRPHLREPRFDPEKCLFEVWDRDPDDTFKEYCTELAINDDEEHALS